MKHCLIVDESKVIRKVARSLMESMNFTVDEAEDGQVALDYCRNRRPDLILLDWNMPVMSGIDFLRALPTIDVPAGEPPKIMFCTTENSVDHIRAAIEAGADEYVMKPFDRDTLLSKLALIGLD